MSDNNKILHLFGLSAEKSASEKIEKIKEQQAAKDAQALPHYDFYKKELAPVIDIIAALPKKNGRKFLVTIKQKCWALEITINYSGGGLKKSFQKEKDKISLQINDTNTIWITRHDIVHDNRKLRKEIKKDIEDLGDPNGGVAWSTYGRGTARRESYNHLQNQLRQNPKFAPDIKSVSETAEALEALGAWFGSVATDRVGELQSLMCPVTPKPPEQNLAP